MPQNPAREHGAWLPSCSTTKDVPWPSNVGISTCIQSQCTLLSSYFTFKSKTGSSTRCSGEECSDMPTSNCLFCFPLASFLLCHSDQCQQHSVLPVAFRQPDTCQNVIPLLCFVMLIRVSASTWLANDPAMWFGTPRLMRQFAHDHAPILVVGWQFAERCYQPSKVGHR